MCTVYNNDIYINLFLESAVFPDDLHCILICIETENNKILIKNTNLARVYTEGGGKEAGPTGPLKGGGSVALPIDLRAITFFKSEN